MSGILCRRRLVRAMALAMFGSIAFVGQLGMSVAHAQESGAKTTRNAWVKLCNRDEKIKKDICVVSQELRNADNGQLLASTSIRMIDGEKNMLIVSVPVGVLLQPGAGVRIDKGQVKKIDYAVCFPNACVAQTPIDNGFITNLKKGGEVVVLVYDTDKQPLGFPMTLTGFTAAYDGAAIDADAYAKAQKDLAAEIQRRAKAAAAKRAAEQDKDAESAPANGE